MQAQIDPKVAPARAATINGQVINTGEVEARAADRLEELDLQRQQMTTRLDRERMNILRTTLDEMVEGQLLALEAQATARTADQLLAERATAPEITDADVDAFYEQLSEQRSQGVPPKDQIAAQIRVHLQQQRQEAARTNYLRQLRAKYKVETFLQEPRVNVATEGQPAKGPAGAPVTIVEFSDFQCPFCGQVEPALAQIVRKYGDKVRLVFRQFPLTSIHPRAQKAAEASLCAGEQEKFWEMHDAMFGDQQRLEPPDLEAKADSIGLDKPKFEQCLGSGRFAERIKDDIKAATVAGVSGTPAFFINGRPLSGALPYEAIARVIDEELARSN